MKRAVSPLIAMMLLLSLTVALGAAIIGWGRQYVDTKTKCLGYSASLSLDSVDVNNNVILITVHNLGTKPIPLFNDNNLAIILRLSDGSKLTCKLGTTPAPNGCIIKEEPNTVITPGYSEDVTVELGSNVNVNNVKTAVMAYGICGYISNEIPIISI